MSPRRPGGTMSRLLFALLALAAFGRVAWSDTLPAKPDRYVTDQPGVLDPGAADQLNTDLAQYERQTSNQILVAIYSSLPPDEDVAQYAADTLDAWGVGQKGKDNGAVLFVFINDHQVFIATGRGLEGALPDATCKNIVSEVITPRFRQGDYTGGVQQGVQAMLAAAQHEYTGTGSTVRDRQDVTSTRRGEIIQFIVVLVILIIAYRSGWRGGGPVIYSSGGWGGGYGGGFGGGGGGGGGGFSGGGGTSAGGGAGGSW